ncbi:hypothetical protein [Cellulomonas sp. S1-8]|uniref:hypothetical protein n=1 Tax=Cellulomonas sp. S1-8 TaxID=2904790 RepID=UPI0022445592|nr:hypothetical protein [Cellulomonas sp. S1-8]UZN03069.1 hypothetical protein OKX07_18770 [Cellulomonas sp. S1-8]
MFLVVYGLGVVRGPAHIRMNDIGDTATSMTDQQLREIAVVAGWGGTTVALWAAVDALAGWEAEGLTAGDSVGRLLAAVMAGSLMASLAALVPARYPPRIQALVDTGKRMNEVEILHQLREWDLADEEIAEVRWSSRSRTTKLVLPVVGQTLAVCAIVIGLLAARHPAAAPNIIALGLLSFAFAVIGAVTLMAPFAFFRAVPRAPILGTFSVLYLLLNVLLSVAYIAVQWGRPVSLTLWCTPIVVVGLRLGLSLLVRRSAPYVAHGGWSVLDRRWWVAAFLETSQPARVAAAGHDADDQPVRGYM